MIYEIFMPALSSTMTEGKIVSWEKSPGDKVEKGETVVIVESDKADMDVESFYEGYLGIILTPAGEAAAVGSTIAYVAETKEEIEEAIKRGSAPAQANNQSANGQSANSQTNGTATAPMPEAAIPELVTASVAAAPVKSDRQIVSPRAKRLAKDHGLDLASISGTGPNGRITAEDIESLLKPAAKAVPVSAPVAIAAVAKVSASTQPAPSPVAGTVQALTTLQNAVIRNMNTSLSVPTFHVGYTITTTALDALYKQIKPKGVTMSTLLAKAVAVTLKKHPLLNAAFTDQGISYKSAINVAIAVAMDDGGLITPVLAQADMVDIYTLSRNWKSLVERARAKQLQPEEYSTGTFTISNLGMFGVDKFDAILPPGTGAILAVGASKPTVVANADGAIAVKSQMQVNITCDHRIIYGAHAAQFLKDLAKLIETNADSLTL
jgi:pyruvate dehydrogenase E2 component (dihydrolipoamide acetyltransferase)